MLTVYMGLRLPAGNCNIKYLNKSNITFFEHYLNSFVMPACVSVYTGSVLIENDFVQLS